MLAGSVRPFGEDRPAGRIAELEPCGAPKLASYLQITDFSQRAPNFGTPHHTAKVLRTARGRIIPGPDLSERLLTTTGYGTTLRDHPGALPQIAFAADDTRHAAA